MVRRTRRARKMQMPIGGLGFLAIVGLVTVVEPGAWWFVVFGFVGGLVVAIALAATRRRALRQPSVRHVLL